MSQIFDFDDVEKELLIFLLFDSGRRMAYPGTGASFSRYVYSGEDRLLRKFDIADYDKASVRLQQKGIWIKSSEHGYSSHDELQFKDRETLLKVEALLKPIYDSRKGPLNQKEGDGPTVINNHGQMNIGNVGGEGNRAENSFNLSEGGSTGKKIFIGVAIGLIVTIIVGVFKLLYSPGSDGGGISEKQAAILEKVLFGTKKDSSGRLIDSVSQFSYDRHVHPFSWPNQDIVKTNIISVLDVYGGADLRAATERFSILTEAAANLVHEDGRLNGFAARCIPAFEILSGYNGSIGNDCLRLCSQDLSRNYAQFFSDKKLVSGVHESMRRENCADKNSLDAQDACGLAWCLNIAIKYSADELYSKIKGKISFK